VNIVSPCHAVLGTAYLLVGGAPEGAHRQVVEFSIPRITFRRNTPMKGKLAVGLLSIAATFAFASMVAAGPIPPLLVSGAMGESDLATDASAGSKTTVTINIDWVVGHTSDPLFASWIGVKGQVGTVMAGDWIYLYQGENTNTFTGFVGKDVDADGVDEPITKGKNMAAFTVDTSLFGSMITAAGDLAISGYAGKGAPACAAGSTCNSDLDTGIAGLYPSHIIGVPAPSETTPEPSLVNEEEGVCPAGDTFGPGGEYDNLTPAEYCFNPFPASGGSVVSSFDAVLGVIYSFFKPPHHETNVMWLASPNPPVYGVGATITTGEVWRTGSTNILGFKGEPIPVPAAVIPEPATVSLFGLGLLVAIAAQRIVRRKRN
jgi:hypothetical protein